MKTLSMAACLSPWRFNTTTFPPPESCNCSDSGIFHTPEDCRRPALAGFSLVLSVPYSSSSCSLDNKISCKALIPFIGVRHTVRKEKNPQDKIALPRNQSCRLLPEKSFIFSFFKGIWPSFLSHPPPFVGKVNPSFANQRENLVGKGACETPKSPDCPIAISTIGKNLNSTQSMSLT